MSYFARRLVHLVLILIAVTFSVSALLSLLPGDAAVTIAGDNASPEEIDEVRSTLNLDEPLVIRYLSWLGNAVQGDLGKSLSNNQDVMEAIVDRLPVTLELVVLAQIVALGYAFVVASLAVWKPNRSFDKISTMVSLVIISIPQFVLAVALVLLFGVQLGWFNVSGFSPVGDGIVPNLRSIALPVIAIAADPAGVYQQLLRNDLGRTMEEPFIVTARSKGLKPARVLVRYGLRPSLFSISTLAGITAARLIGGSVVIESIFALPGVGRLMVDSINHRDYVTLQGVVAVVAVAYVVINSLTDLLYGVLDPRVRAQ